VEEKYGLKKQEYRKKCERIYITGNILQNAHRRFL
jgi:hypothetical protein